jgi:plasmid stability protein
MPTLTVRNVPQRTVKSLKTLARRNGHSMEQEVLLATFDAKVLRSFPEIARRPGALAG